MTPRARRSICCASRSCNLNWHKRYPAEFFTLPDLRDITIAHYAGKDCADIGRAKGLQRLDLRQGSAQALRGLEPLKYPKIVELDIVRQLPNLEELFLDCGANGFDNLRWMGRLEKLVDVLIAVPVLELDWRILFSLPQLQRVIINTHPGYVISDEQSSR